MNPKVLPSTAQSDLMSTENSYGEILFNQWEWGAVCSTHLSRTQYTDRKKQSVWLFVTPWNSPGQNTGVGSLSLLQGIFPAQRLNPGLQLQTDSLPAEAQGKPKNTGVGSLYLLQWIFPTQCLLHFRQILYQLSYQGNPEQVELPELVVTDHGVCFTCNLFERQVEENSGIPKAILLIFQRN